MLCDSHLTGVKTETQNSFRHPVRKAEAGILSFPVTPDLVSQAACSLPQKRHDLSREMPGLWSQMDRGALWEAGSSYLTEFTLACYIDSPVVLKGPQRSTALSGWV